MKNSAHMRETIVSAYLNNVIHFLNENAIPHPPKLFLVNCANKYADLLLKELSKIDGGEEKVGTEFIKTGINYKNKN